jgi:hypothetical protein
MRKEPASMSERALDGFETAFDAMLSGDAGALDPWLAPDGRDRAAIDVYRNSVAKARLDALEALYPTVARLVGRDWFRAAGAEFAAGCQPVTPVLDAFAGDFPDWLAAFPPARGLPYLAPIARIDRAWMRAHIAADAPVLSSGVVAATPAARLFSSTVRLHPSTALFWFDWSAPSIWIANQPDADGSGPVAWDERPEGLLIVRSDRGVAWQRLSRPEWSFLAACRDGHDLGRAARDAFAADPGVNLSTLFAALLAAPAFSTLHPETHDDD